MKRHIIAAACAAVMFVGSAALSAQQPLEGGPGIAVAGSQNFATLPVQIRHFVKKHFKGLSITKCESYFAKGTYELEFSNGIDIDFDRKGKPIEIDAPDGMALNASLVREVIPKAAFKHLEEKGLANNVTSIEFNRDGRAVEVELAIPEPNTYVYDLKGVLVETDD